MIEGLSQEKYKFNCQMSRGWKTFPYCGLIKKSAVNFRNVMMKNRNMVLQINSRQVAEDGSGKLLEQNFEYVKILYQ